MALDEIRQVRLDKLNKLKEKGINPYPAQSKRTHTNIEAQNAFDTLVADATPITISGRVMSLRGQGALIFFDLFDGTGRFQGLFKKDDANLDAFTLFGDTVDIGDFVEVTGPVFLTRTGQKTVQVSSWTMLSKSLLPLPEKWHGLTDEEDKLRKRYLDILMNEELADRFRKRSKFWNVIREYLLEKNFIEVETPVLENTTGGADARPFATHHNALDIDVYLRISCGELWQKRLMVAGLPRTFEIGRIFRNEGISPEHAQDYTQLEYYMAYADYTVGMEMTKELYRKIASEVFEKTTFSIRGHEIDFMKEWEMYDFCEILKKHFDIDALDESLTNETLIAKLKEAKVAFDPKEINISRGVDLLWKSIRKTLSGPGFLVGVPTYLEPLAKRSEKDSRVVERFQVILAGSEMGKGFSELNDPQDQRARFMEQQGLRDAGDDEAQMADFEYVEAMEHGMPPTFGFGLSERLFSFLLDVPIREAQLFPLMKPKNTD
ncbi:MAG: lysine--tRNA ligase [Patescibacteria group bacterium]